MKVGIVVPYSWSYWGGVNEHVELKVEAEGEGVRMSFEAPPEVLRYCVEKGSVAVEGVSLTITDVDDTGFAVALVPHTLAVTTLGRLRPDDEVNLEADVLAKYVERLVPRA